MNLCRTCKHWSVREHMIGVGACINAYAQLRMLGNYPSPVMTAQDFGCVLHEEGPCTANLESPEKRQQILDDYLRSQRPLPS